MRLDRAIDRYLAWRQLEQDSPPSAIADAWSTLRRLSVDNPDATLHDFEGQAGTERLRACLAKRWAKRKASTRAKVISTFHSFFAWAEAEDLIEQDPARKIRRPPKRKPDVYRPTAAEMLLGLRATTMLERPPWLLCMSGLRNSEVRATRWADLDLTRGRVRVKRKGQHWQWLPLGAHVRDELRAIHIVREPDPDEFVFVVESERWHQQTERRRILLDPLKARSASALIRMVARVCKRAGIRPLRPHSLRHGFANEFVRQTRAAWGVADVRTLQTLLGHSRLDTTQQYVDELTGEEAEESLRRLEERLSQAAVSVPSGQIPHMRPAGIEPAVDRADTDGPGDEESDPHLAGHKRRQPGEQGPS